MVGIIRQFSHREYREQVEIAIPIEIGDLEIMMDMSGGDIDKFIRVWALGGTCVNTNTFGVGIFERFIEHQVRVSIKIQVRYERHIREIVRELQAII